MFTPTYSCTDLGPSLHLGLLFRLLHMLPCHARLLHAVPNLLFSKWLLGLILLLTPRWLPLKDSAACPWLLAGEPWLREPFLYLLECASLPPSPASSPSVELAALALA
ncbi:hypothetical protein GOP47_0023178 [Adiantum capillus-veneris]|uniref:Uncharacterized protein n=1 Tax=Adiantum capillus-veneris TaxID=13818 RepID=A0A9D4U8S4_ADICA|nr:hypothetical protein GOP47_0023178 [Adiantum capillus-veneris]